MGGCCGRGGGAGGGGLRGIGGRGAVLEAGEECGAASSSPLRGEGLLRAGGAVVGARWWPWAFPRRPGLAFCQAGLPRGDP